jgi:hypothetical protein
VIEEAVLLLDVEAAPLATLVTVRVTVWDDPQAASTRATATTAAHLGMLWCSAHPQPDPSLNGHSSPGLKPNAHLADIPAGAFPGGVVPQSKGPDSDDKGKTHAQDETGSAVVRRGTRSVVVI